MPDRVLPEEFHLTVTVPLACPDHIRESMRRILNSRRLRSTLRTAARDILKRYPQLGRLRVTLDS